MHFAPPEVSPDSYPQKREVRDKPLATDAQSRSAAIFEQIQEYYRPRLYRTILAITRNHEDAEDAIQDTFMRAYTGLRYFEGRSSVYSWLTRIAINSALMLLRKRRIRGEVFFGSSPDEEISISEAIFRDTAPNPEQLFDQHQRTVGLLREIRKLEPKLQGPILIHLATESSMKEIAKVLNISVPAVKARLHRARRRLKATAIFRPFGRMRVSYAS